MRQWLMAARKKKGLTQLALSRVVGISQATYNRIELGMKNPSVATAMKIAEVLGFHWTRFFEDKKG